MKEKQMVKDRIKALKTMWGYGWNMLTPEMRRAFLMERIMNGLATEARCCAMKNKGRSLGEQQLTVDVARIIALYDEADKVLGE